MIKRIELINFMSHAHTVIEPAKGLTVLVGPNNCGKSAVMSALQILAHNETSTYVTRHGEKECRIIVETIEGDVIEWSRKRSSTKYIVNGQTFDRLKGKVPEEVARLIKLPKVQLEQSSEQFDIHFGNQKEPVFLINETGRAAAGFFAASSDASRLIEMQKLHKQKVTDATRDLGRLQAEQSAAAEKADALAMVPDIAQEFDACSQILESVEIHEVAIKQLSGCIAKLVDHVQRKLALDASATILATTADPPKLNPTTELHSLVDEMDELILRKNKLDSAAKVLQALPQHVGLEDFHETVGLKSLVESISDLYEQQTVASKQNVLLGKLTAPPQPVDTVPLSRLVRDIQSAVSRCQTLRSDLDRLDSDCESLETEIAAYSKSNPTCPTCKQSISKASLLATIRGDVDEE